MTPVVGTPVADEDALFAEGVVAGSFTFERDKVIKFTCPCGCGNINVLQVYRAGPKPAHTAWFWNGNATTPTLSPSIRDLAHCRFHGYLTDGVWQLCSDSGAR